MPPTLVVFFIFRTTNVVAGAGAKQRGCRYGFCRRRAGGLCSILRVQPRGGSDQVVIEHRQALRVNLLEDGIPVASPMGCELYGVKRDHVAEDVTCHWQCVQLWDQLIQCIGHLQVDPSGLAQYEHFLQAFQKIRYTKGTSLLQVVNIPENLARSHDWEQQIKQLSHWLQLMRS